MFAENYIYFDTHRYSKNMTKELYSRFYCSKKLLNDWTKNELEQEFNKIVADTLEGTPWGGMTEIIYLTRIELGDSSYAIWFIWNNSSAWGNVEVLVLDYEHENLGWQTIFYTGDFVYDFDYCYETYQEKCKKYIKKL